MHSESEASNQPCPRVFQGKKCKRRNNASYTQKKKKEFERLISDYLQIPARDLQKQENSVSHSAAQNDNPSYYVQDHQGVDSGIGETDEELDGLELNDLLDDLLLNEVENRVRFL